MLATVSMNAVCVRYSPQPCSAESFYKALIDFAIPAVLFDIVLDRKEIDDDEGAREKRPDRKRGRRAGGHSEIARHLIEDGLRFEHRLARHRNDRRKPHVALAARPADGKRCRLGTPKGTGLRI